MNFNIPFFFAWICLIRVVCLNAQDRAISQKVWQEAGHPYIQNFSPQDYNGEIQNFAIVQDKRGVLFFGNNVGVLSYDGVSWKSIATPGRTAVKSLCLVDDRIYVGANGDMGYLEPDTAGQLNYVSILSDLPEENRDFKDVYDTFAFGDAVYFRTRYYMIRWANGRVRVWKSQKEFRRAFVVNNAFYIIQSETGLFQMMGDSLRLVPGGDIFARMDVRMMLPYDNSKSLIGTFANGLFIYDGSRLERFLTSMDSFLYRDQLRDGAKLAGNLFALATDRGAVIIDTSGNVCQVVNKASGLRDELVIAMSTDRQGGLWLALNNGIARVETPAPISRFEDESGVESFVEALVRHKGRLYATTDRGVSYLDANEFPFPSFKPVSGISSLSFSFLSAGEHLLVGGQNGVFEISGERATKINSMRTRCLYRSKRDTSLVFVGLLEGLAALRWRNARWVELGRIPGISERIMSIAEDSTGSLWLGTQLHGMLKIDLHHGRYFSKELAKLTLTQVGEAESISITRFGRTQGLPSGQINATAVGNRITIATNKGLRCFDSAQQAFVPDSAFGSVFADTSCRITYIREDEQGNVWVLAKTEQKTYVGKAAPKSDGMYSWEDTPFLRLNDIGNVYVIYPEKDGVVWFGGSEGIARFASAIPKDYKVDFSTEIRKVATISSDSVFYSGSGLSSFPRSEMNYGDNSLRFEFAALSYDDVSANRYQVKLDGFDADWSAWTNETKKDYTSLSAGDYTFRARARNIYGHQSSEGGFALTVLPPWYQGLWAYGVYLFVCVSLVYGVVRLRVRQLTKKTEQLEAVVAERTTKLQEQAVKLKELDVMKSRFFANISHEFRTPLTLILGPIEDMLEKTKQHKTKEKLQLVQRSARRLQRLINQLLDLSRLETGKMQLQAYRGDFVEFLRSLVLAFASLAESKSMDLEFEVGPTKPCEGSKPSQGFVDLYFDRDKIEKIFSNLLSNALKFTPVGGKVAVKVTAVTATPPAEADRIEIMVQDTGPGIPADRLPFIFDRFYQVDATSTREREGTGIGLALVKELVELHHGQIGVESRGGEGTTFKVTLPLGKAHLRGEEMASSAPQPETASLYHQPGVESEANTPPARSPDFDEDATVVLVVEDHADVRRYIRGHLQSNYRIVEADDGREGVRVALEVIPDLVISDVMMPKLDGYELCETLKTDEKTSHIPVILLTARAGEEDKLTGLDTGADDYLVKPFNARELQARVRNLIEQRRKLRQRFIREGMLKPREIDAQSLDDLFLQKLMSNIEERMADENFSVEELSQKMNMGPRHLHRKVRALTNKSPVELIRLVRLQRARQLLAQNAGTVSEIAYQVGFTNLSHFSKIFKEEFGKLPSEM